MKRRSVVMGLAGLVVWPTPLLASARAIAGPYRLYRKLERELVDGAGLIVDRSFAIEFSPHAAGGWLIEGRNWLAGDSFSFASTELHRCANPGAVPTRVLWVISPPSY